MCERVLEHERVCVCAPMCARGYLCQLRSGRHPAPLHCGCTAFAIRRCGRQKYEAPLPDGAPWQSASEPCTAQGFARHCPIQVLNLALQNDEGRVRAPTLTASSSMPKAPLAPGSIRACSNGLCHVAQLGHVKHVTRFTKAHCMRVRHTAYVCITGPAG